MALFFRIRERSSKLALFCLRVSQSEERPSEKPGIWPHPSPALTVGTFFPVPWLLDQHVILSLGAKPRGLSFLSPGYWTNM